MHMSYFLTALLQPDNKEITDPIAINNAGFFRIDTFSNVSNRPYGRNDYMLMYINKGVGYLKINGIEKVIGAGEIAFYRPHEPQYYSFYEQDRSEVYWIHFGGNMIDEIIKKTSYRDLNIIPYKNTNKFADSTNFIITELKRKSDFYAINSISKLVNLLVDIHRKQKVNSISPQKLDIIERITKYIEENYSVDNSNEEYAAMCNMSLPYFLRLFKQYTGTSPQHFKLLKRIDASEILLENKEYSISQIAHMVGYNDSLYFCRVFRSTKGCSPSQYRKINNL